DTARPGAGGATGGGEASPPPRPERRTGWRSRQDTEAASRPRRGPPAGAPLRERRGAWEGSPDEQLRRRRSPRHLPPCEEARAVVERHAPLPCARVAAADDWLPLHRRSIPKWQPVDLPQPRSAAAAST